MYLTRSTSGVIEAVGPDVWHRRVGDEVMGISPVSSLVGTQSQVLNIQESYVASKPKKLSHLQGEPRTGNGNTLSLIY